MDKPSGSFVSWNNTLCNPLAPAMEQSRSAWDDGYESGRLAERERLQAFLRQMFDAYSLSSDPGQLKNRENT